MLPAYCIHTQYFRDSVPGGGDRDEIERWYAVLGPTYHHLHHYCWGLMKTNRAKYLARDRQARRFYLNDAISEFDYVLRNATPDFILLPEILTRKGENYVLLGQGPRGLLELEKAIELKPDYPPPYGVISDYYVSSGERGKARATLEAGLKQAPQATALRRRLAELDAEKGSRTNGSHPSPRHRGD